MALKLPLNVNVTHNIDLPDLKGAVDHADAKFRDILRTVGISLAIGIPAVILFAVGANVAGDLAVEKMTTTQDQ